MMLQHGLLGAGAQADEAAEFDVEKPTFIAVSRDFLDPTDPSMIDIATLDPRYTQCPVTAAVGAPALRRDLVAAWSGTRYRSIVASSAQLSSTSRLGAGAIVAPGAILSTNTTIGRHVIVNLAATISHDSLVGDYATIAPGVHIGGSCRIGDGVFLGIGSTVAHGIRIAPGTVLGAGAVATENLLEQGVYVGVPARLIRTTQEWLAHI